MKKKGDLMAEKTCACVLSMIYGAKASSMKEAHYVGCPCFTPAWMRRFDTREENKPIHAIKEVVR